MSGFFSATHRFVTENTGLDAKGHWYSPRRYDAHLDQLPEVSSLRGLNKAEHLNYTIKRLLVLTLREMTTPVIVPVNYSVENGVLTVATGDAVSSTTLQINSQGSSVSSNKLTLS